MPRKKKLTLQNKDANPHAPFNLLRVSLDEVKALGYKEIRVPREIKEDQLLMLTKDGTLWAKIDCPRHLRKYVPKTCLDSLVIYG